MKHYFFLLFFVTAVNAQAQLFTAPTSTTMQALNSGATFETATRVRFTVRVPSKALFLAGLEVDASGCTQTNTTLACRNKGGIISANLIINEAITNRFILNDGFPSAMGSILSALGATTYANLSSYVATTLHTVSGVLPPGNYEALVRIRNVSAYNLQARVGRMTVQVVPE
jgi:hypothetical protein